MATRKVKFHLFFVEYLNVEESKVEDILSMISQLSLDARIKQIKNQRYRLDKATYISATTAMDEHWELEFSKFRLEGPSLTELNKLPIDAKSDKEKFFNETSCALFFPNTDKGKPFFVIQYHFYGMRAASISDYLSSFMTNNSAEFRLALKKDALSRIRKMKVITGIKINVKEVSSDIKSQSANGKGFISGIRNCMKYAGGVRGEIEFKGTKDTSNRLAFNQSDVDDIINFAQDPKNVVEALVISGVEEPDDNIDQVHFFKEKVEFVSTLQIDLFSGRISIMDCIKSAKRAFLNWKSKKYF